MYFYGCLTVPPLITPFTFDGPKLEGWEAQRTCFASEGELPIDIQWTFQGIGTALNTQNGVEISRFGPKSSILSITDLNHNIHTGNYSCTVSNTAGKVTHSAELSVLGNQL